MFGFIVDAIEGTLDAAGNVLTGDISTRDIYFLVDAGLTVYAIADMTGLAVETIQKVIEER